MEQKQIKGGLRGFAPVWSKNRSRREGAYGGLPPCGAKTDPEGRGLTGVYPSIFYIPLLYNANQRDNNYNVCREFPDPFFFDERNYD